MVDEVERKYYYLASVEVFNEKGSLPGVIATWIGRASLAVYY